MLRRGGRLIEYGFPDFSGLAIGFFQPSGAEEDQADSG
jgi:hypothetical protein